MLHVMPRSSEVVDVLLVASDGSEVVVPALLVDENVYRAATFDSRVGILPGDRLVTVTGYDGTLLFTAVDDNSDHLTAVVPATDTPQPTRGWVYDDGDWLVFRCDPDNLDSVHPDALFYDLESHGACSPLSPEAFIASFPAARNQFVSPTDLLWAILDLDDTLPVPFRSRQPRFVSDRMVDDPGAFDALTALSVASIETLPTRTVASGVEWTESIVSDGASAGWMVQGRNLNDGTTVRAVVWVSWVSEFGPGTLNVICPMLAEPAADWLAPVDLIFQAAQSTPAA